MCTGVELALIGAVAAGTAATVYSADQGRKAANQQADAIRRAEEERKAAEARAAQDAQAARADQRRRMRGQSLLAAGAEAQPMASTGASQSTLSYGKQSLGG